jgi:hypothetical protein
VKKSGMKKSGMKKSGAYINLSLKISIVSCKSNKFGSKLQQVGSNLHSIKKTTLKIIHCIYGLMIK